MSQTVIENEYRKITVERPNDDDMPIVRMRIQWKYPDYQFAVYTGLPHPFLSREEAASLTMKRAIDGFINMIRKDLMEGLET